MVVWCFYREEIVQVFYLDDLRDAFVIGASASAGAGATGIAVRDTAADGVSAIGVILGAIRFSLDYDVMDIELCFIQ